MRGYFIRVPSWAKMVYPRAIWSQADIDLPSRLARSPQEVLWTIDDGPDPESTQLWLDALDDMDVKAIFFLIGEKCERYPHLVDAIISAGHQVGSHGYGHIDGWRTNVDHYIADVKKSLEVIDTQLFRPPFGRMTRGQHKKISMMCDIMMWSVMPGDFDHRVSSDLLEYRISETHKDDIIVLHDSIYSFKKCKNALKNHNNLIIN